MGFVWGTYGLFGHVMWCRRRGSLTFIRRFNVLSVKKVHIPGELFRNVMGRVESALSHGVNIMSRKNAIVTYSRLNRVNRMEGNIISTNIFTKLRAYISNYACGTFNGSIRPRCTIFLRNASSVDGRFTSIVTVTLGRVGRAGSRGFSESGFIGGIVLSGVLPKSVCVGDHRLRFGGSTAEIIFVVHIPRGASISIFSIVRGFFPSGTGSFIVGMGRASVTLIGRIHPGIRVGSLRGLTHSVYSALSARFCYGTIINVNAYMANIGRLTHSFGRTRISLRINGIFSARRPVTDCRGLNVTHLVCRLPAALYRVCLGRIFGTNSVRSLSRRALFAVRGFFRGGLGISRADHGLFIREGALICELRGVGGVANLSLERFSSTVMFGITLVIGGCLRSDPIGC